ncbi:MAG: hypothetical protein ACI9IV_001397, partial [Paracoccaceae bacterium]
RKIRLHPCALSGGENYEADLHEELFPKWLGLCIRWGPRRKGAVGHLA